MPYGIVATSDGFVGKAWLMRQIGCIPTQKFVSDLTLVRDIDYLLKKKKTSVLMYPEAGYSLDGRATILPRKMGGLLKLLKVPVLSVHVDGAFLRTPLYNELKNRKVPISAEVKCLLTADEICDKSVEELDAILDDAFDFDHFKWQKENNIRITEPYRANGLERLLYKCPHCQAERKMKGEGEHLTCHACGKVWRLTELGEMEALDGETEISHIPAWFDWERECVRREIEEGPMRLKPRLRSVCLLITRRSIWWATDIFRTPKRDLPLRDARASWNISRSPVRPTQSIPIITFMNAAILFPSATAIVSIIASSRMTHP